jgi:hypothetical protein
MSVRPRLVGAKIFMGGKIDLQSMLAAYEQTLRGYPPPETTLIAFLEGTWMLKTGQELVLLGEAEDFTGIMLNFIRQGFDFQIGVSEDL